MKVNPVRKMSEVPALSDADLHDAAARIGKAIGDAQHNAGTMGLPALLDARRIKYNIPNEAFDSMAYHDRIYLWQVDPLHQEKIVERDGPEAAGKFAGTGLYMPDVSRKASREETPRGVLVSAGLTALDHLVSHGITLGHLVNFVRLAPWRIPIASYGGHLQYLMVLRSGDIIGSEDVAANLKSKRIEVVVDRTQGAATHVLVDDKGERWVPQIPFVDESY